MILLLGFLLIFILNHYTFSEILIGIFPLILYGVVELVILRRNAYSKVNKNYYKSRTYQFDEKFIAYTMPDGGEGKINWRTIIKTRKRPHYYLLYISRGQFIYVPVDCFKTEDDRLKFENFLEKRFSLTINLDTVIKTKEIKQTPQIFFRLWRKRNFKSLIKIFCFYFVVLNIVDILIGLYTQSANTGASFFRILIPTLQSYLQFWWIVIPINLGASLLGISIKVLSAWILYRSKKNPLFYKPFYYEIDQKFIKTIKADGTENAYAWDSIGKVEKIDEYYILLLATSNALFVPLSAFASC